MKDIIKLPIQYPFPLFLSWDNVDLRHSCFQLWHMNHDCSKFRLIMAIQLPNFQPLLQLIFEPYEDFRDTGRSKSLEGFLGKPLLYKYNRTNVTGTLLSSVVSALNADMGGVWRHNSLWSVGVRNTEDVRKDDLQRTRPWHSWPLPAVNSLSEGSMRRTFLHVFFSCFYIVWWRITEKVDGQQKQLATISSASMSANNHQK